ncbi:DnaJ domain-containing protein [Halenospora varia]|nr:DnaJ domain-containing protein [Halenospora varia]
MAPSDQDQDHYSILGLQSNCTLDQITKAYRRLALVHHPDKNGNNAEATLKFQKISNAHDILKDVEKRRKFDRERRSAPSYPHSSSGHSGWNPPHGPRNPPGAPPRRRTSPPPRTRRESQEAFERTRQDYRHRTFREGAPPPQAPPPPQYWTEERMRAAFGQTRSEYQNATFSGAHNAEFNWRTNNTFPKQPNHGAFESEAYWQYQYQTSQPFKSRTGTRAGGEERYNYQYPYPGYTGFNHQAHTKFGYESNDGLPRFGDTKPDHRFYRERDWYSSNNPHREPFNEPGNSPQDPSSGNSFKKHRTTEPPKFPHNPASPPRPDFGAWPRSSNPPPVPPCENKPQWQDPQHPSSHGDSQFYEAKRKYKSLTIQHDELRELWESQHKELSYISQTWLETEAGGIPLGFYEFRQAYEDPAERRKAILEELTRRFDELKSRRSKVETDLHEIEREMVALRDANSRSSNQ